MGWESVYNLERLSLQEYQVASGIAPAESGPREGAEP